MQNTDSISYTKLIVRHPSNGKNYSAATVKTCLKQQRISQNLIMLSEIIGDGHGAGDALTQIEEIGIQYFQAAEYENPEQVLEEILSAMNEKIPEIAAPDDRWLDRLSLLIGVSEHGQIHFAQVGTLRALHLQTNSAAFVEEHEKSLNPMRLFSHITSGVLGPGDTMIFTTNSLTDYVSVDRLQQLSERYQPNALIGRLTQLLSHAPQFATFAAIFIKFTTHSTQINDRASKRNPASASPYKTSDDEIDFNKQTARSYTDVRVASRNSGILEYRRTSTLGLLNQFIRFLIHNAAIYISLISQVIVQFVFALYRMARMAAVSARRREQEKNFVTQTHTAIQSFRNILLQTPVRARRATILLIVLLFILMHTLILRSQKQSAEFISDTFAETLLIISSKRAAVDNAILYENQKTAESLLVDINLLLQGLKPASKDQLLQISSYIEENQRTLNKIRHINVIDDPFLLADLRPAVANTATSIAFALDGYYVSADSKLFHIKDGVVSGTELAAAPRPINSIKTDGSSTIAILDDGTPFVLSRTELKEVSLKRHPENSESSDFELYGGNLYTLDSINSSIYKHTAGQGNSFKDGILWGKLDAELDGAVDMTIDGSVFLLLKSGLIVNLLRGKRVDFEYTPLQPAIGENAKIYTLKDSDFIYVLDPTNKRVAILSKNGIIKDQYISEKFDSLIGLAIHPTEDALAVLNGSKIYLLAINK